MLNTIIICIFAAALFFIMIVSHEFGHFIMAKISGVRVIEFSVGMGPKLLSWGKGETEYFLRLIPLGGFCVMDSTDPDAEDVPDDERAFNRQPAYIKILILLAGPMMNILVCALILLCCYVSMGHGFLISLQSALAGTGYYSVVIWQSLVEMISGNVASDEIVGIVGVAGIIAEQAKYGFTNIAMIMAMISANLAIINLLPFPALDGGRIVLSVVRGILGDRFSERAEAVINAIGMIVLMLLMIYLIFKDTIGVIFQ